MDAITLLEHDHDTVDALFKKFEQAGPHAYEAKREIVGRIIEELSVHAAIEEQVFYPTIRDEVDGVEDQTLESLEEHHVVKWLLSELETMAPDDERYKAKTTVLIENVRHHVEEEEQDLFPKVRKALSARQLDELGDDLAHAKEMAPRRPHPRSPDTPPGNLVVGPAAAVVDKVAERVKGAISDTVGRVTGSNGNGSTSAARKATTKKTATKAKTSSPVRKARRTTKKATTAAKRSTPARTAKKATTAAKRSTPARTAKKATTSARTSGPARTAKKATTASKKSGPARTARKATTTAKRSARKATASAR